MYLPKISQRAQPRFALKVSCSLGSEIIFGYGDVRRGEKDPLKKIIGLPPVAFGKSPDLTFHGTVFTTGHGTMLIPTSSFNRLSLRPLYFRTANVQEVSYKYY
jgi:hypothetical protein